MEKRVPYSQVFSWALYDWANSAFITTVIAGFYPVFFKSYWSSGLSAAESTSILGTMHAAASIMSAVFALIAGIVASNHRRFRILLWTSIVAGSAATVLLAFVSQGAWLFASILCITAQLGYSTSLVCYDSLLPSVARGRSADKISALGYALGYLGGGLQFFICLLLYKNPQAFGFANEAATLRAAFAFVGVWWLAFGLPLLLMPFPQSFTLDHKGSSFSELVRILRASHRSIPLFLAAYWIYIDGVNSIVKMAIDYGMARGLQPSDLVTALLITQFVGFPATFLYGYIGAKIGTKRAILAGIAGYSILTFWGSTLSSTREFYSIACAIGFLQGGVQALSRSFFAVMIPQEHAPQLFGVFNMVSKFSSILGPLVIAGVTFATGRNDLGVLSLLLFFGIGGFLLSRVPASLNCLAVSDLEH